MFLTFINIIRWKELLYLVFVLFLFKFCFLYGYGFKTTLSFIDLGVLSLSGALMLSSGHLINFYYRKKNTKDKTIAKAAKKTATLSLFFSLLIGALLSYKIQETSYIFVLSICFCVVFIYSKFVRKKTFLNNIVKSFLKSSIILLVLWFDTPIDLSLKQWRLFFLLENIMIIYVMLSFISNVIREIIIDINNINDDNVKKNSTLPLLFGRRRARNITLTIAIIGGFLVFLLALLNLNNTFILTTILLLGTLPELIFIYFLFKASTNKEYSFLYKLCNIIYLLSLLSVPIIAYYFKYVVN